MKTKARKVGDGWRVNADGSFAFRRGRNGTEMIPGTVRSSRRSRRKENARRAEAAIAAFVILFR